ncbi:hypothetical protein AV530_013375 [Patagioenas fasciata monilis]|uniref:Uncharacterized protein n=1 Tax=Patagioenas fasciata monilis TaxID=372326 RepID=A0A1V4JP48_PATFA|nr:hypothetical protein AV530_013375 [Patagioenas fasciata monilis]
MFGSLRRRFQPLRSKDSYPRSSIGPAPTTKVCKLLQTGIICKKTIMQSLQLVREGTAFHLHLTSYLFSPHPGPPATTHSSQNKAHQESFV